MPFGKEKVDRQRYKGRRSRRQDSHAGLWRRSSAPYFESVELCDVTAETVKETLARFHQRVEDIHNAMVLLTLLEGKPVYQDEDWNL